MSQNNSPPIYSCQKCEKKCSTQNSLFTHTLQCCPELAASLSRREKRVQTVADIERAVAARREAVLPALQKKENNNEKKIKKNQEKKNDMENHEIVAQSDNLAPVEVVDPNQRAIVNCSHCNEEIQKGTEDDTAVICDAAPNSCFLHLRCVAQLNKHAHGLFSSKRNEKEVLEMPFYCARHQKELESNAIAKMIFEKAKKEFEAKYGGVDGTISVPISAAQRDMHTFGDLSDDSEVSAFGGINDNENLHNNDNIKDVDARAQANADNAAASASADVASNSPGTINTFKRLFSQNSDLKRMQARATDASSDSALRSAAASADVGKHDLSRKRRLSAGSSSSTGPKKIKDKGYFLRLNIAKAKEKVREYGAQFYEANVTNYNGTEGAIIRCKLCNVNIAKDTSISVHNGTNGHKQKVESFNSFTNNSNENTAGLIQPKLAPSAFGAELQLRERIVRTLLKNGIPLNTIEDDSFRSILKSPAKGYGELPKSRRTYADLIPSILAQERKKMKLLYKKRKNVFVVYDGTTRIAQVMGVILFYFDDEFNMHKEVVRVDHRTGHDNGESLALYLKNLMEELEITGTNLVGFQHDRCAVNQKAARLLCGLAISSFYRAFDSQCISHGLSVAASKGDLDIRDQFINHLNTIFSMSHDGASAIAWRECMGSRWPGKGMVRWFSHHELCRYFFTTYAKERFDKFLRRLENESCSQALVAKVKRLHSTQFVTILVQLAVGIDIGDVMARATYNAERDGPHSHVVHSMIENVNDRLDKALNTHTQLTSIARTYKTDERSEEMLIDEGLQYVRPIVTYFKREFYNESGDYYAVMAVHQACELIDPRYFIQCDQEECKRRLDHFIWLSDSDKAALMAERADYRQVALGVDITRREKEIEKDDWDILNFWRQNRNALPHWFELAQSALLIQSSSASVERLFSALKRLFDDSRTSQLEDARELACRAEQNRVYTMRTIQ